MSTKGKTKKTAEKVRSSPKTSLNLSKEKGVPVAYQRHTSHTEPHVTYSANACTISHREFFGAESLASGTDDTVDWWTVQPGWSTIMPWASTIVTRFERYQFEELSFEFIPRVPTTTAGTVLLAFEPDPNDPEILVGEPGRIQLLNKQAVSECSVWSSLKISVRSKTLLEKGRLFVRNDLETGTMDARLSDLGKLYVAVYGYPARTDATVIGDLWINYKIRLSQPILVVPELVPVTEGNVLSSSHGTDASLNEWNTSARAAGSANRTLLITGGTWSSTLSYYADWLNTFTYYLNKVSGVLTFVANRILCSYQGPNAADPLFVGRVVITFNAWKSGSGSVCPANFDMLAQVCDDSGFTRYSLLQEGIEWAQSPLSADPDRAIVTGIYSGIIPGRSSGYGLCPYIENMPGWSVYGPVNVTLIGDFVSATLEPEELQRRVNAMRHRSKPVRSDVRKYRRFASLPNAGLSPPVYPGTDSSAAACESAAPVARTAAPQPWLGRDDRTPTRKS